LQGGCVADATAVARLPNEAGGYKQTRRRSDVSPYLPTRSLTSAQRLHGFHRRHRLQPTTGCSPRPTVDFVSAGSPPADPPSLAPCCLFVRLCVRFAFACLCGVAWCGVACVHTRFAARLRRVERPDATFGPELESIVYCGGGRAGPTGLAVGVGRQGGSSCCCCC